MFNSRKWRGLSRLKPYLLRHRGPLTTGFICILLTNVFLLATPQVMGYAVDRLKESVTREKLATYAVVIIVLAILEGIFRFFMRRLMIGVSRDIEYSIRNDVFEYLETLPMSFYQKNKTGDLM